MQSRKISTTVSLPNRSELPTADFFAESFWRNLPSSGRISHRVGPTNQTPYQISVLTYVIAKIPSCERKVRERLRDSRNSITRKKKSWKAPW
jgi:hypothetical protein